MELKIQLSKIECNKLLKKYGYTIEDVYGWYDTESFMTKESDNVRLSCAKITIAYLPHEEKIVKGKKHPMLSFLKNYSCDNVVAKIIKGKLLNCCGIF